MEHFWAGSQFVMAQFHTKRIHRKAHNAAISGKRWCVLILWVQQFKGDVFLNLKIMRGKKRERFVVVVVVVVHSGGLT